LRLAAVLAFALTGCIVDPETFFGDLFIQERETDPNWVRIEHPELPVSFEVPSNKVAPVRRVYWAFGTPSPGEDEPRLRLLYWGNRLVRRSLNSHAVEFGFLWVTTSFKGIEADWLAELEALVDRPEAVGGLYLEVFQRGASHVRLEKYRSVTVDDAYPAAAFSGHKIGKRGHRYWEVSVLVVPFGRSGVLLGIGWGKPRVPRGELDEVFTRVVESLRIRPDALPR
jgi:hypothetical protein